MDSTLVWALLPLWTGLALALLSGVIAHFALGLHRAARTRVDCGLSALRTLRWREFIGLLRDVFRARGYEVYDEIVEPGHCGAHLALLRDGTRQLVQVKHGEVYLLRAEDVRAMIGLVASSGATGGVLVSSGRLDLDALAAARDQPIEILADVHLWSQAKPFLTEGLVIAAKAAARSHRRARRRKLMAIMLCAALTAMLATMLVQWLQASRAPAPPASTAGQPVAASDSVGRPAGTDPRPEPETQTEQQRQQLLSALPEIEGMRAAVWASKSTLRISIARRPGLDDELQFSQVRAQVCALLSGFGQLRDSRLQIHLVDLKTGLDGPARYKLCD